jgi:hypothetical protein
LLTEVAATKIRASLQGSCSIHGWKLDADNNATIRSDECAVGEPSKFSTLAGADLQTLILGPQVCDKSKMLDGIASVAYPSVYVLQNNLSPGCLIFAVDFYNSRTVTLITLECATDQKTADDILNAFSKQLETFASSNSIGAGDGSSGYAVGLKTQEGRWALSQQTTDWGLNHDYVGHWLSRILEVASKIDLTLNKDHSPLPNADYQQSVGRLALWMFSGLVQISSSTALDRFGTRALAIRDWMSLNIFNDPKAFDGALLRKDFAVTDR